MVKYRIFFDANFIFEVYPSVMLIGGIKVWQYLLVEDVSAVLLAAVQYIPAGIALGWTYEKSNNIWAPIMMHMVINAISFGLLTFL